MNPFSVAKPWIAGRMLSAFLACHPTSLCESSKELDNAFSGGHDQVAGTSSPFSTDAGKCQLLTCFLPFSASDRWIYYFRNHQGAAQIVVGVARGDNAQAKILSPVDV